MIQPDFANFSASPNRATSSGYDVFPADLLTPVSAYLRIAQGAGIPSSRKRRRRREKIARYTLRARTPRKFSATPMARAFWKAVTAWFGRSATPSPFCANASNVFVPVRLPRLPPLVAGASAIQYDMVRLIERIPKRLRDEIGLYDAMLMFYHGLVAFDNVQHRL